MAIESNTGKLPPTHTGPEEKESNEHEPSDAYIYATEHAQKPVTYHWRTKLHPRLGQGDQSIPASNQSENIDGLAKNLWQNASKHPNPTMQKVGKSSYRLSFALPEEKRQLFQQIDETDPSVDTIRNLTEEEQEQFLQELKASGEATKKPEQLTPEKAQQLMNELRLLEAFKEHDYREVRGALAECDYAQLIDRRDNFDKRRAALNNAHQTAHLQEMPISINTKDTRALARLLLPYVTSKNRYGRAIDGSGEPLTEEAMYNYGYLDYGSSIPEDSPLATFYINPRTEHAGEVIALLDTILQKSDAQMKINTDGFEPGSTNKLVVYMRAGDVQTIDNFLKGLNTNLPYLNLWLEPMNFPKSLRVPLHPGISFVERPNGQSWDTRFWDLLKNKEVYRTVWPWNQSGQVPNRSQWRAAINPKEGRGRNTHMPALLADDVLARAVEKQQTPAEKKQAD